MSTIDTQSVDPALLATMNRSETAKSATQAAQDRFMTLLVTQMKNQDPLNPLDNAQVTSQLAQLSTVTGIDKLNETVAAMSASFQSGQSLQATNMIGHGVVVPGTNVELKDGKSILGFDLPQAADRVSVQIKDSHGTLVRTLTVDAMSAGMNTISWNGKNDAGTMMANGNYQFSVVATAGDKKVDVTNLSFGMVSSVSFGKQGAQLTVANIGDFALGDVRQVF